MDWIEMDWIKKNFQKRKVPAYVRTAGIDEEGRVFASAALTGNERDAVLRAVWDGVPAVIHDGHVFLPTSWLARDCPHIELPCEKIEARLCAAFAAQGPDDE
jgi:hypothetical protein